MRAERGWFGTHTPQNMLQKAWSEDVLIKHHGCQCNSSNLCETCLYWENTRVSEEAVSLGDCDLRLPVHRGVSCAIIFQWQLFTRWNGCRLCVEIECIQYLCSLAHWNALFKWVTCTQRQFMKLLFNFSFPCTFTWIWVIPLSAHYEPTKGVQRCLARKWCCKLTSKSISVLVVQCGPANSSLDQPSDR